MASLQRAILCRRILIDEETKTMSFIDALETMGAAQMPAHLPPMWLSTLWLRESEEDSLQFRVRILAPNGKSLGAVGSEERLKLEKRRHRVNVKFGGALLEEPGEYKFLVEQLKVGNKKWTTEQSISLDLSSEEVGEGATT